MVKPDSDEDDIFFFEKQQVKQLISLGDLMILILKNEAASEGKETYNITSEEPSAAEGKF